MKEVFAALAVATLGCVVYHAGQKAISPSVNPMVLLLGVYAVAFLMALAALPFFRGAGAPGLRALASWPVVAVGLGALLIEIGFLLAYRAGGSMQWGGVAVNAAAAVILVPVAVLVFRESFSPSKALGIVVTLAGMALLVRK